MLSTLLIKSVKLYQNGIAACPVVFQFIPEYSRGCSESKKKVYFLGHGLRPRPHTPKVGRYRGLQRGQPAGNLKNTVLLVLRRFPDFFTGARSVDPAPAKTKTGKCSDCGKVKLIYGDFCPGEPMFNFPLHWSEQFHWDFSIGAG